MSPPPTASCSISPSGTTTQTNILISTFESAGSGGFPLDHGQVQMRQAPISGSFGSWVAIDGFDMKDVVFVGASNFTYQFRYQVWNTNNQVSGWASCGEVTIQPVKKPVVSCNIDPRGWTNQTRITIRTQEEDQSGTGLASGQTQFRSAQDEQAFGPWTNFGGTGLGDRIFDGANNFKYQFRYQATDNTGAVSDWAWCGQAKIDQTPPQGSCTTALANGTKIKVRLEESDNWSGVSSLSFTDVRSSKDDGATWSSWSRAANGFLDFIFDGQMATLYEFRYTIIDNATNSTETFCRQKTISPGAIHLRVWEVKADGTPLAPLNGATVKLTDPSGTTVLQTAVSKTIDFIPGMVKFENLMPGNYGVLAYMVGTEETFIGFSKQTTCTTWTTANATLGPNPITEGQVAAWDNEVQVESGKITTCQDLGLRNIGAPPIVNNLRVFVNHCINSFRPRLVWTYDDPDGNPQRAFQVQIDGNFDGIFSSSAPDIDSGQVVSGNTDWVTDLPQLFGKTFAWKVTVWDLADPSQSTSAQSSYSTPIHAYPQVDFTFTPTQPKDGEVVTFTDTTVYADLNPAGRKQTWDFTDATPTFASGPGVETIFHGIGSHFATLSVTDSDGFFCQETKTINVK